MIHTRIKAKRYSAAAIALAVALSAGLAGGAESVKGRYVRVDIPGRATLSLAEVQIFSGKTNVARNCKTVQSSMAHGGVPSRAVDGNTNGDWGCGSITHTIENTDTPAWEVDLGKVQTIDRIVVWNRTGYESRLDGFRVTVLDTGRKVVCEQTHGKAGTGATTLTPGAFAKSKRAGKTLKPVAQNTATVSQSRSKGTSRPRKVVNTNWYVRKATWWETILASADAMHDEVVKVRAAALKARAADPAVQKFAPVKVARADGDNKACTFQADVTGLKRVFLGVDTSGVQVSFTKVRLVGADGQAVALPVSGRDSVVSGTYGARFRAGARGEDGSSFTLHSGAVGLDLEGKYAAIEGTFVRIGRNRKAFAVTVDVSHPAEFAGEIPAWHKHLEGLVQKDFAKDAQAARDMAFEIRKARIYQKPWPRGDYAEVVRRYERIASATVKARIGELAKTARTAADVGKARELMVRGATCEALLARVKYGTRPLVMAIEDLTRTFPKQYTNGPKYLARAKQYEQTLPKIIAALKAADVSVADQVEEYLAFQRKALLENPLLTFDKLLMTKGSIGLATNWGGANRLGSEMVTLSPVAPDGKVETIYKGSVSSFDLSFDAKKVLFSDGSRIKEVNVDGTGLRTISKGESRSYNPCRLPGGKIMFVSTACEQAVPCTGGGGVGNMHVMNDDGSGERRITFDQDHNWDPCMLENGRVVFTRWEYTDLPHYFSRLLMSMNPDGTDQKEYYGSSSYWPNAMYWTRPIPGGAGKVVCVISGHHGVSRMGELLIFDPSKGRHEADGVVQRIPGWGQTVEPIIRDNLVGNSWPRFITPWPLAEPGTNKGSGKYFLATVKMTPNAPWGLYIVDVFDNMVPILTGDYTMPTPLRPRPAPPVVAERIDLKRKDAVVYLTDIYVGGGLKGYPKGSVKALRVGSHHYRYPGNGDTGASAYEGGWDSKIILGTVPVYQDGSAVFQVPANTPIFVQPLDADGKSLQVMRSWFTAMPGERLMCIGCHESQNTAPPTRMTMASRKTPSPIAPWYGPARGFSYNREVQPVLDRRCAGCHNGKPRKDGKTIPDLRAMRLHEDFKGRYSPSYMVLQKYVRRPGFESDYHLPNPAEYQADTSALVQMLKKGHPSSPTGSDATGHVKLTREEWDRLYTWIDFNVPFAANWRESHRPPKDSQVLKRAKYLKLYASINDMNENPFELPEIAEFQPPAPAPARPKPVKLDGWPLSPAAAAELQTKTQLPDLELDLGDGVTMKMVPVPAGRFVMGETTAFADENTERVVEIAKPFYIAQFEVTNAQFARFAPDHDSRYIDGRGKDRSNRGRPINGPKYAAVRMTWKQAAAFCEWLSKKTGRRCSLPTEEQWEYACRAGADGPLPRARGASSSMPPGRGKSNAWRISDMTENVAEWTASTYDPRGAAPFQDAALVADTRVVRGSTWDDKARMAPTISRWRYRTCHPVYNVGFRVVCDVPQTKVVAKD